VLSALLSLLIRIVLELHYLVQVVRCALFLDVFIYEISQTHLTHSQRVVGVQYRAATTIGRYQWIFVGGTAVGRIGSYQIRLLRHPHLLQVLHPLIVLN